MSKKSRRRELHKKILKMGAAVAILIAAVGVGALVFWLQNQNRQVEAPQADSNTNPITGLEDRTPPVIKEAQDLATKGNIDESNTKLDEALKKAGSSLDKYNIYMQQGTNFANQKNYQKALETLQLANSQQQTANATKLMGEMALLLGQKAEAKTYFEKAITLLDDASPLYPADKRRLEDKIKEIGG